ncbi:MAG: hypothetical protein PHO00_01465 [bacterium]|nr:hypothetical protein [bacterium]
MKKAVVFLAVLSVAFFIASPLFAMAKKAETQDVPAASDKSTAEKVVTYPFKLTGETVKTGGNVVKNSTETVVGTVEATGETLTGDVKKAPEIVTTPIKGTATTAKDAVVDTVETPARACQ